VSDGVERQDRRDRLVDLLLHRVEQLARPLSALPEDADVAVADAEEHRFQDGAEEGCRQGEGEDPGECDHAFENSGGVRSPDNPPKHDGRPAPKDEPASSVLSRTPGPVSLPLHRGA